MTRRLKVIIDCGCPVYSPSIVCHIVLIVETQIDISGYAFYHFPFAVPLPSSCSKLFSALVLILKDRIQQTKETGQTTVE